MSKEEANEALLSAAEEGDVEALKAALAAGADVNATADNFGCTTALMLAAENGYAECVKILIDAGADVNAECEFGDTALSLATLHDQDSCVEILKAAGAEGDCEIQQEDEDDDDDFDDEDSEEEITIWEGNIFKMWKHDMYIPGDMPELLNVGENDCLMFVRTIAQEISKWSKCEYEYIDIWLKREGGEWANICCPKVNGGESPEYPEDWNWQEILDKVWDKKTVTYTTKLNEDCEQVEATWEVEE